MGTLFGTDGIRGIANESLNNNLAYRVGLATAYQLRKEVGRRPMVAVGKDTRISSDMIEAALSAGLCAGGATVVQLGVVPTPAVAYLTVTTTPTPASSSPRPTTPTSITASRCSPPRGSS